MKKRILLFALCVLTYSNLFSQAYEHEQSKTYIYPTDPLVKQKLDQWQDQKFGMIIHWGLYTVGGVIESWPLVSEEEDWLKRTPDMTYTEFKKWYWDLSYLFNPVKFNPDQWAEAGKMAGMKYVVFTTKHHDGFCLFDTKETTFSTMNGPFKDNPKANIAKYVFESFRNQDFMIGAYFSKPDWHSQYYWWDKYATYDRNNNYDIRKNSERWEMFKSFCYNQINELTSNFGKIDIVWLDGGQVSPITPELKAWFGKSYRGSQDLDMAKIATMARKNQPGVLMVDRTVVGPYENYQTPEQTIPDKQLTEPWESCITLGNYWSHMPNDTYKSSHWVIHTLTEIVAKGGSLLLGVGPTSEGVLYEDVIKRLDEIGVWTSKNGEAIYGTRITPHYNSGKTWFTQSKNAKTIYAITCIEEKSTTPTTIEWEGNIPAKGATMTLLHANVAVSYKVFNNKVLVNIPKGLPKNLPALAFRYNN
ncbi:MAG: hypothetical protein RL662_1037 [Bacteroidota bacterium]|jgi:alpha-L-fucosidase